MAGDGGNDAAAIRLADIGIGLAAHGSTAARAAADLILTDPDLTRILDALNEGRALWASVRDAVAILLGGNAGEVAFTVLGTALSGRAPLGTRQLLLVNLLTDMLPALAVAHRTPIPDDTSMTQPAPALWGPDFTRLLAIRGTATTLGALTAWQTGRLTGRPRRADTMGLAALITTQLGQTLITGAAPSSWPPPQPPPPPSSPSSRPPASATSSAAPPWAPSPGPPSPPAQPAPPSPPRSHPIS